VKWVVRVLVLLVVLFALAQIVPYGRSHSNPPVTSEAPWTDPAVKTLARDACYDCHSNETVWPWYANIAPVSWVMQWDVDSGRKNLNFSEWGTARGESDDPAGAVRDGSMPLWFYPPMHPNAKLTPAERAQLADALQALSSGAPGAGNSPSGG
jgi:cytochrome c551/c552